MKKGFKTALLCITVVLAASFLTGCIPGDGSNSIFHPAGFFSGVWHGWIAPISLVASLFNKSFSIYEVYNTGFFYNLGYYAAIVSGFGGLSLARKKSKN